MHPNRDTTVRGFTLVEMLIVISLIALLIAMLMPALSRAKMMTLQTVCAGNLKGSSMAALVYSADNKSYLFPFYKVLQNQTGQSANQFFCRDWPNSSVGVWVPKQSLSDSNGVRNTGHDLRMPAKGYINDWRIWQCPSVSSNSVTIDSTKNSNTTLYGNYDYVPGSNYPFHKNVDTTLTPAPSKADDAGNAAHRAMIDDVTRDLTTGSGLPYFVNHAKNASLAWGAAGLSLNPSYNGYYFKDRTLILGSNTAFYDNHVQWLNLDQLVRTGQATDNISDGYMLGYMP